MHFLKKRTLHCALYSLLHFSKHKLTWTLNLNTLSLNTLWCKYSDIVYKIFVGMFACSRLKSIMNYCFVFVFCSYLKPKRDYIWISLSIIAITGHLAEWMDVGLNKESETIKFGTPTEILWFIPWFLFIWEDLYYLMNYRVYITPQTKNWNMDLKISAPTAPVVT